MATRHDAEAVVFQLRNNNYEAYWVGGCVRDMLLGREPKDFDIVTNALPDEVLSIFPNHYLTGKKFGVVTVRVGDSVFEVATYRSEQSYSDHRRPDKITWSTAKEDVLRRDFTINGLLYDPISHKVTDYVDGERDLSIGLIRCIGDPVARLSEDPLRVLRAIRLKNALNMQYDQETYRALATAAKDIQHVAMERVGDELTKMLKDSSRLIAIQDLDQLGLLRQILPEVEATKGTPQPKAYHQEGDVFQHLLRSVGALPKQAPSFLVWATLLHDVAKPQTVRYPSSNTGRITTYGHAKQSAAVASRILSRMRRSREEIEVVVWLIAHHMSLANIEQLRPVKQERFVLDPRFPWLLELHHADAAGAVPVDLSLYQEDLKLYRRMKQEHERQTSLVVQVLVNGHDLVEELGMVPGPEIGKMLDNIRDAQLGGQVSTKLEALTFARSILNL